MHKKVISLESHSSPVNVDGNGKCQNSRMLVERGPSDATGQNCSNFKHENMAQILRETLLIRM